MLPDPTTDFVRRLRGRDPAAWFELWENFGPVLRAQLVRWGRGRIGPETVQDLSQETLAALSGAIDRHDPSRGARFSTWLLAIAHHSLCGEMDRRMAQKRGAGKRDRSLEDEGAPESHEPSPDAHYEQEVFDAKVAAALRAVQRDAGFADFAVYQARVLEGRSGKTVAEGLALSEATVSRRAAVVRAKLRQRLAETFARYSFSREEWAELARNGLETNPNKGDEGQFDAAVAEVYHRINESARTRAVSSGSGSSPGSSPGPAPRPAGDLASLGRAVRSLLSSRGSSRDSEGVRPHLSR